MLLTTIGLWALNLTVSRYILTHGFQPLAYATTRYGLAVVVFIALGLAIERSLRIQRRDLGLVLGAAALVYVNQIGFVYALETTSASVVGLVLGATPIFAALAGVALGTETLHARFWTGALLSFAGVALVALGSGGVSGDLGGVLLGVLTAATWAGYSMIVTRSWAATRRRGSARSCSGSPGCQSRSPGSRSSLTRTGTSAGRCGRCSSSRRSGRS
jgi:drug/metabolite transporter (DMT)-like permease